MTLAGKMSKMARGAPAIERPGAAVYRFEPSDGAAENRIPKNGGGYDARRAVLPYRFYPAQKPARFQKGVPQGRETQRVPFLRKR
jgi:hypothetical protein